MFRLDGEISLSLTAVDVFDEKILMELFALIISKYILLKEYAIDMPSPDENDSFEAYCKFTVSFETVSGFASVIDMLRMLLSSIAEEAKLSFSLSESF